MPIRMSCEMERGLAQVQGVFEYLVCGFELIFVN